MRFASRVDAGRKLADLVARRGVPDDTVVLGLPRGGVPVAHEVAIALDLPLDVIIVRKLGVPSQPELAMGAIGEDGARILNDEVISVAGIRPEDIALVEKRELAELERRVELFRGAHPRIPLTGRTALIIDDGIATGSTVRAACEVARAHGARRVVVATPVAPPRTVDLLLEDADEVVCLSTPSPFWAIGEFYDDFTQTKDEEVAQLLDGAANHRRTAARREKPTKRDPLLEHAAEEAEGIEYFADSGHDALFVAAREEAQGIEVFSNPDGTLPASALREGDPGHESFTGDDLGLGRDADEERGR